MHSGRKGVNKFEYGCFFITYVYDRHMEITAIIQQPGSDDQWKSLLQFPEWPFIKVELEPSMHSGREGVNKFEYVFFLYHICL